MQPTRTVARQCTLCEAHCGIRVTVAGDRIAGIEGDPDDVLSAGYLCPKATALADIHHDPDRVRRPLRRVGDRFEEVTWDEALALAGRRLRQLRRRHGRHSIGIYIGNPAAHSPSLLYAMLLRGVLATRNAYSASSVDQFPQELVAWQMFGHNALLPVVDIDRTDHLLVLGANPAVSNGSISTMPDATGRIRAIRERGGRVVVVDPRRTETARLADEHVAIEPGGDAYLLLAMLHVLFTDGLTYPPHLDGLLAGTEELRRLAARWTPADAAPLTGVDAEVIARLAREFAAAPSAVAYARLGVCQQVTGTVTHWLVNALNAVTGNLDRPGGQMFTTPPVDPLPWLTRLPVTQGRHRGRSGLAELRGELPVAGLADEILADAPDRLRAMITYAGNPVLSAPGGQRLDEAFASLEFHVAVDLYVTETSRHADLILPPVSPLEREELDVLFPIFSVRNHARYNRAVLPPPPEGRDDWEILGGLATEVVPGPTLAPLRRAARRLLAHLGPLRLTAVGLAVGPHGVLRRGRKGLRLRTVRDAPGGVDLGPLEPRLPGRLATRDRRVRLAPPRFVAEARRLLDAAAAGRPVGGRPDQTFDLRLIGRRHLRSNNSWLHNVPAMVKGRDRCTVLVHPDDAAARALADGDRARVASRVGEIELPVEVSDEILPGTVAIPHGWGHDVDGVGWSTARAHAGVNVNRLTDPSLVDALSGNGALNGTWVRIEAVVGAGAAVPPPHLGRGPASGRDRGRQ